MSKDDRSYSNGSENLENLMRGGKASKHVWQNKVNLSQIKKLIPIIISILISLSSLGSILQYFIIGDKTNYSILSFRFDHYDDPFRTHSASLIILIMVIIAGYCLNIYCIASSKDDQYMVILAKDIFIFYLITSFTLMFSFLFGMILTQSFFSVMMNLIFSFLSLTSTIMMYKKIKSRRNFSTLSLISQNIFISIQLSFLTYIVIFGILHAATIDYDHNSEEYPELNSALSISGIGIYAAASIVCISTLKDIVYPFVFIIILIGFLANPTILFSELITGFSIMGFILFAMIITITRYKKLAFGYEDNKEMIQDLRNAHDMLSNK